MTGCAGEMKRAEGIGPNVRLWTLREECPAGSQSTSRVGSTSAPKFPQTGRDSTEFRFP